MARIVLLHGIGQQYLGPASMHHDIAAALIDGVWLAGGPKLQEDDIKVAFYGDWFRRRGAKGDLWLDASDIVDPFEIDFLVAVWALAAELEPNEVPAPGQPHQKVAVPFSVQRAINALSRSSWLAGMADNFLLGVLRQVRRYLTEADTRAFVQCRLAECIEADTRLLIGHSLGSVAAYEALCANPDWPVSSLLTLGSPLGISNIVFQRLNPSPRNGRGSWPGSVQCWINICDRYDIVALVKELNPLFKGGETLNVEDRIVENGWQAHDLKRHLTAEETGEAVTRGLNAIR
jgi:hypothetical protein